MTEIDRQIQGFAKGDAIVSRFAVVHRCVRVYVAEGVEWVETDCRAGASARSAVDFRPYVSGAHGDLEHCDACFGAAS